MPDEYGTEDLFDVTPYVGQGYRESAGSPRSASQGNCPRCSRKKVGLIRLPSGHLAWRMHMVTTWGGTAVPCQAAGVYVCDLPEAMPYHNESGPVRCAHR